MVGPRGNDDEEICPKGSVTVFCRSTEAANIPRRRNKPPRAAAPLYEDDDWYADDPYDVAEDTFLSVSQPGGRAKNSGKRGKSRLGPRKNFQSDINLQRRPKMGNEESTPVDESVPSQTLETRTLDGLGKYIRSGKAHKIVVMSGAGISTSAGIPDFRSPDTGLYANLQRLNLPYAEAVFDISYFRQNPKPFYTLAHELYPGKFRPTIAHSFIRLLHDKGLLMMHFTQNIDCLDREAGVPQESIIEAHGSFAKQSCIECGVQFPKDEMLDFVQRMEVPRCKRSECDGLVKPEIVFFGEALPSNFFSNRSLPASSDLCIILGTSLTVQPFASLPTMAEEGTPRVLINLERVGGIGSRPDDVLLLGDCDDGVRKLADACGWLEELEKLWETTKPALAADSMLDDKPKHPMSKDDAVKDEIDKLTEDIDKTLKLSYMHGRSVMSDPSMVQRVAEHLDGKIGPDQLAKARDRATTADTEASGANTEERSNLQHVFPHVDKKSSL
ncbi:MAG: Sir2 histone deacetylase Hst2 [Chrysothrix sp. TS-e1954]|nr:MAG: Sir2 histone deacetylase Hst2 [Chrysothrix sp. TS-e1954]